MGATAAADVGRLLYRVGTAVDHGQKQSFVEGLVAAKEVMRPGPKYSVTSRSGKKYQAKPVFDDPRFGGRRLFSKIGYRPAGPAFWTEYGTKSHWIIPHALGVARGDTERVGVVGGAKALKFGNRYAAWAFVRGVRARPFWRKTRHEVQRVAGVVVQKSVKRNILLAGFGR